MKPLPDDATGILESPYSGAAEASVINFIFAGYSELLTELEPEDFVGNNMFRTLFVAAQKVWSRHKSTDMIEICTETKYDYVHVACALEEYETIHSKSTFIRILRKMRAAREIKQFRNKIMNAHIEDIPDLLAEERIIMAKIIPSETTTTKEDLIREMQEETVTFLSGYDQYDALTQGFAAGTLSIISARPSIGKTTLACNIAARMLSEDISIDFFSLEMSRKQVLTKLLCCLYDVSPEKALSNVTDLITNIQTPFNIFQDIYNLKAIQTQVLQSQSNVIFIDYMNLIESESSEGWLQRLEQTSRTLKILSKEAQKPIILLHQMNRNIEQDKTNRTPILSDLRGAGEQDADLVSFLHDPNATEADIVAADLEGTGEDLIWIIKKNRHGSTGTVNLSFNKPTMQIIERETTFTPTYTQQSILQDKENEKTQT